MLLRPLFFTSFLIDDQLDDEKLSGRGPILISSASSKTAIAAAFLLAQREDVELIGLTSPRSAEFVAGLGVYGRTVTYDEIDSLERGAGHLRRRRRRRRGAPRRPLPLRRRAAGEHGGRRHPLGGVRQRRRRAAGADAVPLLRPRPGRQALRRTGAAPASRPGSPTAWHPFCEWTEGWLGTIRDDGFDGLLSAWPEVLENRVDPRSAHVITLG